MVTVGLKSCHELAACGNGLINQGHKSVNHMAMIITSMNDLISSGHELTMCGNSSVILTNPFL